MTVLRPVIVGALGLPNFAGPVGLVVVSALAVLLYLAVAARVRRPVHEELDRLRAETNGLVEIVVLDAVWLPIGAVERSDHRPGLLLAGGDGIRLTDLDRAETVLDASWREVDDILTTRAPHPIIEVQLHRDGAHTQWWFGVWSPLSDRLPAWLRSWRRETRVDWLVGSLTVLRVAGSRGDAPAPTP